MSDVNMLIRFVARRCLQAVPLLLVVSMLVFLLIHAAPGGPLAIYLATFVLVFARRPFLDA